MMTEASFYFAVSSRMPVEVIVSKVSLSFGCLRKRDTAAWIHTAKMLIIQFVQSQQTARSCLNIDFCKANGRGRFQE